MADASDANVEPTKSPEDKPYHRSQVWLARMSWLIPLASFGMWIILYTAAINNLFGEMLYPGGFVVFVSGVVSGFVFAVLALVQGRKYPGIMGHAIGGLVITIALALLATVGTILASGMLLSGLAR